LHFFKASFEFSVFLLFCSISFLEAILTMLLRADVSCSEEISLLATSTVPNCNPLSVLTITLSSFSTFIPFGQK
jgi:hypothetical protein